MGESFPACGRDRFARRGDKKGRDPSCGKAGSSPSGKAGSLPSGKAGSSPSGKEGGSPSVWKGPGGGHLVARARAPSKWQGAFRQEMQSPFLRQRGRVPYTLTNRRGPPSCGKGRFLPPCGEEDDPPTVCQGGGGGPHFVLGGGGPPSSVEKVGSPLPYVARRWVLHRVQKEVSPSI